MRRGVAVGMGCALVLAGVAAAQARGERELTNDDLRAEMAKNSALAVYVKRNGMPDVAEAHFLADEPPWDDHEVTLYYLDAHKEVGFARAFILGSPEVHMKRYVRPLTDEQVAALASRAKARAKQAPAPDAPAAPGDPAPAGAEQMAGLGPDERAERAAARAEDAAGRVEAAADSAEHAADRAEAVAARAERAFHRGVRK